MKNITLALLCLNAIFGPFSVPYSDVNTKDLTFSVPTEQHAAFFGGNHGQSATDITGRMMSIEGCGGALATVCDPSSSWSRSNLG